MTEDNQLVTDETPGIGHNQGPEFLEVIDLPTLLADLREDRARGDDLVATFNKALIVDGPTATSATQLAAQIKEHGEKVDARRVDRKKPFLEQERLIDEQYGSIIKPLETAYAALRKMLNTFIQRQAAEAAAEKARALEEQRQRQIDADRLREAAEKAAANPAGDTARLQALRAQEDADSAARRAEAIRPEPIRSDAGSVGSVRVRQFEITDPKVLLAALFKTERAALLEAIEPIVKRKLDGFSFENIEKNQGGALDGLPGVRAWVGARAAVRRR
jgi:hypothetical protein